MFTLMLILSSLLQVQETNLQNSSAKGASKGSNSGLAKADTPEQALRVFLVAMAIKDAETLRSVTLPTKDFEWLLKGEVVPPDHIDEFRQIVAKIPIRALKPGEEFTLPRNRKMKVGPDEVGPARAVLLPENAPMPNRVQKVDGRWRVDATPIIAGRKAAEAARMKAKPSNR